MNKGMQNPNDFHPSPSYKKQLKMQDSVESGESRLMNSKPLIRNSRKLQEYNESQDDNESGSNTPPGNDDDELGHDLSSVMQQTAINFIRNNDFQENHEKELTVNDDEE